MKKWHKISLILLAVLILMVMGSAILVKQYLGPETIRSVVVPALEEVIKYEIVFSSIEVGLGGTITLKEVTFRDPTDPQHTVPLKSQGLVLHAHILPLLLKKIIIEKITLSQPLLTLTRDAQGNYNLIKTKNAPEPAEPEVRETKKAKRDALETSLSLPITSLTIDQGTLTFTDYYKNPAAPFELTIEDINLRASNISAVSPFPVNLSAEIVSNPSAFLKCKALINPLRREVESKVELTPLEITRFSPYLPPLPLTLVKGFCALDLTVTVNKSLDLSSQGVLSLEDITFSPAGAPEEGSPGTLIEGLSNITINLDHRLSYTPAEDTLTLEKLDATLQKVKFSLKGKVAQCKTNPLIDVTLDADKLSLRDLSDSIPPDLLPEVKDLLSSGTTEAHLSIKGELKKPRAWETNGSVTIDQWRLQPSQLPSCSAQTEGKISFSGQRIHIDQLKTTFKNSLLTVKGNIDNYLKGPLTAELQCTSPSLTLDEIISCIQEHKGTPVTREEAEKGKEERGEIGPFTLKDAKVNAAISLESIKYKNMHLSNVKATCRLKDNVLTLEPLTGKLNEGSFNLKGRIDLGVKGLEYSLQLSGNNLQLNPLMTSLAPTLKETIEGTAHLTTELRGSGSTSDTLKKHLEGEGKITIERGKVTGFRPLQTISSFIKTEKLDTLTFDHAEQTFQIHDGVIGTEGSLTGNDIEFYPKGTISLDSQLDLSLDIKLSPAFSAQIANEVLTKYFHDQRGWTVVTFTLKGPYNELAVIPAPATIKKISEMLIDIILKKEDVDSSTREEKKKALEDLMKELIKKSKENKEKKVP